MKEGILDVLMYLFENYMMEDADHHPDQESLTRELSRVGFGETNITRAFDWLEHLADLCHLESEDLTGSADTAIRHFSPDECERLDISARGLLLSLVHGGVLTSVERELVIDRLLALDAMDLEMDHVKCVIMMIMGNRSENPSDYTWIEDYMFDDVQPIFH